MKPIIGGWIGPTSALITDKNPSYGKIRASFRRHHMIQHNENHNENMKARAHINTSEAVNAIVQRALIGANHRLGRRHLQRYLDEIIWRWNHTTLESKVRKQKSSSGLSTAETMTVWKPIPVVAQMRGLLGEAVGRQLRRTPAWGLRWP